MLTVDRNILPGMKPTRHSFSCGQPFGPGVAHHGMRTIVHHAKVHVASPSRTNLQLAAETCEFPSLSMVPV